MLPKQYRLKNHKAFEATYSQKNRVSNKFVIIYKGRLKKDFSQPTRIGFVVSKKISKRAVKRNRLKRLFREAVRLLIKSNTFKNFDNYQSLVFVVKQTETPPTLQDCIDTINTLLK